MEKCRSVDYPAGEWQGWSQHTEAARATIDQFRLGQLVDSVRRVREAGEGFRLRAGLYDKACAR